MKTIPKNRQNLPSDEGDVSHVEIFLVIYFQGQSFVLFISVDKVLFHHYVR